MQPKGDPHYLVRVVMLKRKPQNFTQLEILVYIRKWDKILINSVDELISKLSDDIALIKPRRIRKSVYVQINTSDLNEGVGSISISGLATITLQEVYGHFNGSNLRYFMDEKKGTIRAGNDDPTTSPIQIS